MHVMAKRKDEPSETGPGEAEPLRRRVIVELRPDEIPLLAAAETRHGTKRAAFVRALEAESRLQAIEEELALARSKLAALEKEVATEQAARASEEKAHERSVAKLAVLKRDAAKFKAGRVSAEGDAHGLSLRVRELENELAEREEEIAELERIAFGHLFCARCKAWAPEKEWAFREGEGGEYAYHRPCGDHGPGLLEASSRLAWRPL